VASHRHSYLDERTESLPYIIRRRISLWWRTDLPVSLALRSPPKREKSLGRVLCLQPIVCHSTMLTASHSTMLMAGHLFNFQIGLDLEEKGHTLLGSPTTHGPNGRISW